MNRVERGNDWDFGPDQDTNKKELKPYDQYLQGKAEPQVKELLTDYGPVALIWFDTPRMMTKQRAQRFTNLVRSTQPKTLIDGRLGDKGDYVSTGDNVIRLAKATSTGRFPPQRTTPGDSAKTTLTGKRRVTSSSSSSTRSARVGITC